VIKNKGKGSPILKSNIETGADYGF